MVKHVGLFKSVMTPIIFPLRITWPGGVWFRGPVIVPARWLPWVMTQPWIALRRVKEFGREITWLRGVEETLLIGSPRDGGTVLRGVEGEISI